MNTVFSIKLFFFLILFGHVQLEENKIKENIISSISIDVENKIMEDQILFFGVNEYNSFLLKYHIETNYICYLQYLHNFLFKKLIKICNSDINTKDSINLLLVDDELLIFDYYYNLSISNNQDKFYILYPSSRNLEGKIPQNLKNPIFLLKEKLFQIIKYNIKSNNNITIKITFDNTSELIPYNYIILSRFFPTISLFLGLTMIFISKKNLFYKFFILLTLITFLYNIMYVKNLKDSLTYNIDYYENLFRMENIYEVLGNILNGFFQVMFFSFLILLSKGFGILYYSLNIGNAQNIYLLLIITYIFISTDPIFELFSFKIFIFSFREVKRLFVNLYISIYCIRNINKCKKFLQSYLVYSISFNRNYLFLVMEKLIFFTCLNGIIIMYLIFYIFSLLIFKKYEKSSYYLLIQNSNEENIYCFYLDLTIFFFVFDKNKFVGIRSIEDLNIIKYWGISKCKLNKIPHPILSIKMSIKNNTPLIIINPFNKINKNNENLINNLKLGKISID